MVPTTYSHHCVVLSHDVPELASAMEHLQRLWYVISTIAIKDC